MFSFIIVELRSTYMTVCSSAGVIVQIRRGQVKCEAGMSVFLPFGL